MMIIFFVILVQIKLCDQTIISIPLSSISLPFPFATTNPLKNVFLLEPETIQIQPSPKFEQSLAKL